MNRTLKSAGAIGAVTLLAALSLGACSSAEPSSPTTLPTPRSLPAHLTVDHGIRLLREAGLSVNAVEDSRFASVRFGQSAIRQVSVDGHSTVWVIEYAEPPERSFLTGAFSVNADFTAERYPRLIPFGNLVYLIRGIDDDVFTGILTAVWDIVPPGELNMFGNTLEGYDYYSTDVSNFVATFLSARSGRGIVSGPVMTQALTTLREFAAIYGFNSLVGILPHPDSIVWINQFVNESGGGFVTVASEMTSGIPVAEIKSAEVLDYSAMRLEPLPVFSTVEAFDGDLGEFDELHTVVSAQIPPPTLHPGPDWPEQVDSFVIERSVPGGEEWQSIAWLRSDGWDMTGHRPTRFIPPAGRVEAEFFGDGMPVIRYWDYDVESGKRYDYRVHGCTNFGRQTAFSVIVSAVAGDPDPTTQDVAAHVPSIVEDVDCSIERN